MADATAVVFIVDDDISVRESLELLVQSAGGQSETFASAHDFLARPRATVACCLVLDVTLPGLNGLECSSQLAERADLPIIFITGYGDVPVTVRAMKARAVDFLTKPFKDGVLLDAIGEAIERSRAQHPLQLKKTPQTIAFSRGSRRRQPVALRGGVRAYKSGRDTSTLAHRTVVQPQSGRVAAKTCSTCG